MKKLCLEIKKNRVILESLRNLFWLFVKWAANLLLWAAKLFFWAATFLLFWQQKWAAKIIFLGSKNSYFEQQI
jgi:hypothetical protein